MPPRSTKRRRIDQGENSQPTTPSTNIGSQVDEELDLYDDFEGALERSSRSQRGGNSGNRGKTTSNPANGRSNDEADELATPSKRRSEASRTTRGRSQGTLTPIKVRGKRKSTSRTPKAADAPATKAPSKQHANASDTPQSSKKRRSELLVEDENDELAESVSVTPKKARINDKVDTTPRSTRAVLERNPRTQNTSIKSTSKSKGEIVPNQRTRDHSTTHAGSVDSPEADDLDQISKTYAPVPTPRKSPGLKNQLPKSIRKQAASSSVIAQEPSTSIATSHTRTPQSKRRRDSSRSVPNFTQIRQIVMEKLTGHRAIPLVGLDEEYKKVHHIMEQSIIAGESNSLLVIGSRGCGKTAIVKEAVRELSIHHRDNFHVVRLNGLIQTDDKLALREIWRQLGKEMELEDDGIAKNYADTLSTILALLSHPSEQQTAEGQGVGQDNQQVAKSVIFVMDEFDLFATHPRQTLLYNLFDIAQSRKAPIAVIGLSTRIDVSESLEKRVKSRFSHRYVHISQAPTFSSFLDIGIAALSIQQQELDFRERSDLKSSALTTWNSFVEDLFANETLQSTLLAPHYYLAKSIPALLGSFVIPLSAIHDDILTSPSQFISSITSNASILLTPDSKLSLLPSLSSLQLSLLIAACRLDLLLDASACNFNMAYNEYVSLASKARIQNATAGSLATGGAGAKVWRKDVARKEWEKLVSFELLMPSLTGSTAEVGTNGMVKADVSLEEIIPSLGTGMDKTLEKWCKQI